MKEVWRRQVNDFHTLFEEIGRNWTDGMQLIKCIIFQNLKFTKCKTATAISGILTLGCTYIRLMSQIFPRNFLRMLKNVRGSGILLFGTQI